MPRISWPTNSATDELAMSSGGLLALNSAIVNQEVRLRNLSKRPFAAAPVPVWKRAFDIVSQLGLYSFFIIKFRTMVPDGVLASYLASHPEAQREWDADHKLRNDPRATMLGRTMRRLSLILVTAPTK